MDFDSSTFASINQYGGVDYAPHNKGVTPIFFVKEVQDFAASEREGRAVYINKEVVLLHVVGDSGTAASHPVDAGIKARFRDQYEAWKRKESPDHINGTPLKMWPMASPAMIRELESLNVFSVDDLALVSDGNIQNITDGRAIREKAIAWLKSAADGAAVLRYAAENDRLREEMAELRKAIQSMGGTVGEPNTPPVPRAKRAPTGRPKKDARRSAWTPERRKAASDAMKARGGVGRHITEAPSDAEAP